MEGAGFLHICSDGEGEVRLKVLLRKGLYFYELTFDGSFKIK
jgi:hypothetical protein